MMTLVRIAVEQELMGANQKPDQKVVRVATLKRAPHCDWWPADKGQRS